MLKIQIEFNTHVDEGRIQAILRQKKLLRHLAEFRLLLDDPLLEFFLPPLQKIDLIDSVVQA